jgi:lactate dehydrogenase-like 2-hydroxyacid dehydrogenase
MATLTTDRRSGRIAGYNIQWHEGKKRRTIHLGAKRYSRKTAERLKDIVEKVLYYRRNAAIPDKSTEHWLKNAPDGIKSKLAKAGLIIVASVCFASDCNFTQGCTIVRKWLAAL